MTEVLPGVLFTLIAWMLAGEFFRPLSCRVRSYYVTYYAGLASAMIGSCFSI